MGIILSLFSRWKVKSQGGENLAQGPSVAELGFDLGSTASLASPLSHSKRSTEQAPKPRPRLDEWEVGGYQGNPQTPMQSTLGPGK